MKKIVLVLMVLMVSKLSYAQKQNEKGLYIDENGQLLSAVISSVNNGVKSELTVVNGIIEGEAKYYAANGQVLETGSFSNGLKNDKWIRYNANNTVSAVAFYNIGKKHGTWLVFDEKGIKRMEMNYNNGDKTGVWFTYDEAGALVSSKDYTQAAN